MKKQIIKLSVLVFVVLMTSNCSKEFQPKNYLSKDETVEMREFSSTTIKGGNEKKSKISHKEYGEHSRMAFAKLHKKLVKAYWKNHSKFKTSLKGEVIDSIGLDIPPEALILELTEEIAQDYVTDMYIPSYRYLISNFTLDSLDDLSNDETIAYAMYGMSLTNLDQAGYQIDEFIDFANFEYVSPAGDPTSLSSEIGICLSQALGAGIVMSIKDLDIAKMSIGEAMVFVRKTFIRSAGFYITGVSMAYQFGVCMGWLYDIFDRD